MTPKARNARQKTRNARTKTLNILRKAFWFLTCSWIRSRCFRNSGAGKPSNRKRFATKHIFWACEWTCSGLLVFFLFWGLRILHALEYGPRPRHVSKTWDFVTPKQKKHANIWNNVRRTLCVLACPWSSLELFGFGDRQKPKSTKCLWKTLCPFNDLVVSS